MALKRPICNDFESLGSEGRLETDGAFAVVIMYKEHGTGRSICDGFESLGSEGRLETDGAFAVVIMYNDHGTKAINLR